MAIVVLEAWEQRGWDNYDHLIDDTDMQKIVGDEFPTVKQALKAASRLASRGGPVAVKYRKDSGEVWVTGNEPDIPGRTRLNKMVSPAPPSYAYDDDDRIDPAFDDDWW